MRFHQCQKRNSLVSRAFIYLPYGRLAYDAINIDACMFDFQPNNHAPTSVAVSIN